MFCAVLETNFPTPSKKLTTGCVASTKPFMRFCCNVIRFLRVTPITPPITLPINSTLLLVDVIASLIPIQPCSKLNNTFVDSMPRAFAIFLPISQNAAVTDLIGAIISSNALFKD